MSKIVTIKLKNAGPRLGPFEIKTSTGIVLAMDVSRTALKNGIVYEVDDNVGSIFISSTGAVKLTKNFPIGVFGTSEYAKVKFVFSGKSGMWSHLTSPLIYNNFYNNTEPYIIEYPFSYKFHDEILQYVKDHSKVYMYLSSGDNTFSDFSKVETDDIWFNKAILYNDQQSSGLLNLVPKPKNNLSSHGNYPIYDDNSKTITFSKSDNFYQYNTFWNVLKDVTKTQFVRDCESLSIDKKINHSNMDYSSRVYKKQPLRAKALKIRHILDNRSDVNLVSQFLITPAQNSFR